MRDEGCLLMFCKSSGRLEQELTLCQLNSQTIAEYVTAEETNGTQEITLS